MSANLLDNPKLFRHLVEDLPVGIYIVDGEGLIRFWNHGAEQLTGHLVHDVLGHVFEDVVRACDRRGNSMSGECCPVTMTLSRRQPQQCTAFYLHKNGHRTAVRLHTRPILEYGDTIGGCCVLFEEAFAYREEANAPAMYGCLDPTTGIPSQRLTRAVLNECMEGMRTTRTGFGLLRIRVLGLDEFRTKHGPQSAGPFMRTAAHTLRHSLDAAHFLGCWGEHEFLAVMPSASPMMVATTGEVLQNLLRHSEVSWWGDHFPVETEISSTVATAGKELESILLGMKPSHASTPERMAGTKAAGAGAASNSRRWRG